MPRKLGVTDYTSIDTLIGLQRQSISAGGSSQIDFQDPQAPSSSSFRYFAPGSPLKSTQQLPIDWSNFANHTYFSSAIANVNVAFDTIINNFPFDGTFREIEDFFDGLTGFEAYVFNQFPKSINSLMFDGGSWIEVIDAAGSKFPELSRNKTGASVLDPGASSISFQMKIFVPPEQSDNQVILQRLSGNSGYTLAVSESLSTSVANILFAYSSGSSCLSSSISINKGEWVDIAAIFNRRPGINRLQLYVTGTFVASSSNISELSVNTVLSSPLYIGTGSLHSSGPFTFLPAHHLSASLDDLKIFVGNRTQSEIQYASENPTEPNSNLRLMYKFNEPSGSYARNSIVIDSSGNGLHSTVTGFTESLRNSSLNTGGPASFGERLSYSPVLFPDFPELVTINTNLLASASEYDANNPNYIVKLIPPHYLEQEQAFLGLQSVDGNIGQEFSDGGNLPRSTPLGSVQIITMLLLIWAKQFDELKMHIAQLSRLNRVDFKANGGIADTFLPFLAREYGIELPRLFSDPTYLQYIHGDNLASDSEIGTNSLYKIESEIWRRILVNLPVILKSKGTVFSLKNIIRSMGIDPDVTLRFKEYGGANSGYITGRRMTKRDINFTNTGSFLLTSPYLSGTRVEPGLPQLAGNSSDGLFTTGSFFIEGHYKLSESQKSDASLLRLLTTGSYGHALALNMIVQASGTYGGSAGNVTLSGSYSSDTANPKRFSLTLNNLPIYDGKPFYLSVGRDRESNTTSKWYLRFGKNVGQNLFLSESYSSVIVPGGSDILSVVSPAYNASGSFFQVGTSTISNGASAIFLNDSALPSISKLSSQDSAVSQLRFWSKYLSGSEWQEHVRNPLNLGVTNPAVNFNFTTTESGSFGRLRIDAGFDQPITASNSSGEISILDFTQNNLNLSGSGFEASTKAIFGHEMNFNAINPYFDESSTEDKVRVRSWVLEENSLKYGGETQPVYQVDPAEKPTDDNRFGIEISVARALNEDILLMFGGHQPIDNIYGNPTDIFAVEYTGERHLRDIYFNRLQSSISFKEVFLFAKWFESNIERLVSQFLPFNTDFQGVNLVIESHVLERHKLAYNWARNWSRLDYKQSTGE
jgi:hypothetical protein